MKVQALIVIGILAILASAAIAEPPRMKMTTDIPESIMIPGYGRNQVRSA